MNWLDGDIWFIIFGISIAILCVAAAVIFKIKSRKSLLLDREYKGYFQSKIEAKKKALLSTPGALAPNVYQTILFVAPIAFGVVLYLFFNGFVLMVAGMIFGLFVPELISKHLENREKQAFEVKYERSLREMNSSLRAGMSISQAVGQVSDCPFIDERIRKEFRHVDSDIKVGKSIKEAFQNMADRVHTSDTQDVATAISFQSDIGGSEAEIIENISNSISSRISQRKEVRSLFSGSSTTVAVMSILPFVILITCVAMMPDIKEYYLSSAINIAVALVLLAIMVAGVFITRKLANKAKKIK